VVEAEVASMVVEATAVADTGKVSRSIAGNEKPALPRQAGFLSLRNKGTGATPAANGKGFVREVAAK